MKITVYELPAGWYLARAREAAALMSTNLWSFSRERQGF
jgi:hypothetical protein